MDLSTLKVGQDIRFALVQEHAGEYVLEHIYSGENGSGELSEVPAGQFPESGAVAAAAEPVEQRRVTAAAVVRGVYPDEFRVRLEHEPIAELEWPAMTMNFEVDPEVSLDALEDGQDIHFSMVEGPGGGWVIDQIHVMSAGKQDGDGGND